MIAKRIKVSVTQIMGPELLVIHPWDFKFEEYPLVHDKIIKELLKVPSTTLEIKSLRNTQMLDRFLPPWLRERTIPSGGKQNRRTVIIFQSEEEIKSVSPVCAWTMNGFWLQVTQKIFCGGKNKAKRSHDKLINFHNVCMSPFCTSLCIHICKLQIQNASGNLVFAMDLRKSRNQICMWAAQCTFKIN